MKHLKLKHHQKLNQRKKDGLIRDLINSKNKLRSQKTFLKLMVNQKKSHLFLVVLGGRAKKANVELHDVRWVIGSKIEDTYDLLRRDWFGMREGLHIDSFKKISYVD